MTAVVVLDVNETLSDLGPFADRFAEVGLSRADMAPWFTGVLRDGFALSMMGRSARFPDLARDGLRRLLTGSASVDVDAAVPLLLDAFMRMNVHPDVPEGLRRLHEAGYRLVTLTNGSPDFAEGLLERAGVAHLIEAHLSVDAVGAWKPDPRAYAYAGETLDEPLDSMLMVATHAWDTAGAKRAGMAAAWLQREQGSYPAVFDEPDIRSSDLIDLAEHLTGR